MSGPDGDVTETFELALRTPDDATYVLKLYVTGASAHSARAIHNLREICDEFLSGRYALEVVDLGKDPAVGRRIDLVAAPTLVKESPLPECRVVGDLSDHARVLLRLGLGGSGESR